MTDRVGFSYQSTDDDARSVRDDGWTPSEWMVEPGANCAPLEPPSFGLVKTLPRHDVSVFDQRLPPLQDEITAVNEKYLETTTGLAANKWFAVGLVIMTTPFVLAMPPYLGWWFVVEEGFKDMPGISLTLVVVALAIVFMYAGLFSIAFLSPLDEPIRFCRSDRKIYRYQAPRVRIFGFDVYLWGRCKVGVYDWAQCRAEVVRRIVASGRSVRRDCFLELAVVDVNTQEVRERFRVGDREVHGDFSTRVLLWETLRRYMQDGTGHVPPPTLRVHRGTLIDCIEDFNPFSMPAKSSPGAQRFVGYVLGGIVWTVSLLVLTMVLSRWISINASRKVDWGSLEETVFKLDPSDPALHRSLQPEDVVPDLWAQELNRRRQAASLWLLSCVFQTAGLWWFFATPSYYR